MRNPEETLEKPIKIICGISEWIFKRYSKNPRKNLLKELLKDFVIRTLEKVLIRYLEKKKTKVFAR